MPDVENLLREELKRAAERVQPELLRPLQVPTRRLSWRPRLLPLAAAAAVIAVVTAGALVAGLTAAHQPAAHQPAAHQPAAVGPAPASLPRFYVTTSSPPDGRGIQAVVRASASGQVTGTVPVPSAIPVEWADSGGTFVTAAAGFEQRSELIEAFRRLPARQREVLALRYYVDMSVADAAATLHISEGAVRSTASRGLDALARILPSRSSKEA